MSFSINLGNWNSVFAVPSVVVDQHIKLAGSAQLKVLLWVLRHAGENFSEEDISSDLAMHKADVKDSMQYWIENRLISVSENKITPGQSLEKVSSSTSLEQTCVDNINDRQEKVKKRMSLRPQRPDPDYINKRINESEEIKFLIQEAEIILSRPVSNSDIESFVMFHDVDGLPIDVIIMLLQYAVSVGKTNLKYIEKVAIDWGNDGIDSIEKVEEKLKQLTKKQKAWKIVEQIVGIDHRLPSAKEDETANRWINEWHFSKELINEAYERCVNAKGKFILSYMDSIIKRWRANDITTISQAVEERTSNARTKKNYSSYPASYDLYEYEKESLFD